MKKKIVRNINFLFIKIVLTLFIVISPFIVKGMAKEVSASETTAKFESYKTTTCIGTGVYARDYIESNYKDYTYKSSNSNIISVNKYGEGRTHELGTAIMTAYKTVKGKSVKVAQIEVAVVPAKLKIKECKIPIGVPTDALQYDNYSIETYIFKASNPKVVGVTNYTNLIGLSAGSSDVTVYAKYKGKTRKLGTINVIVVEAEMNIKDKTIAIWDGDENNGELPFDMQYVNGSATYTYSSSNPKIVKVNKEYGYFWGINYGKATITVNETYNNKTRKVGSVTVTVSHAVIEPSERADEIYVNHLFGIYSQGAATNIINILYKNKKAKYSYESANENIISIVPDYNDELNVINVVSLGETSLTVYEEYKGIKKKVGMINITVKEPILTGIEFHHSIIDLFETIYIGKDYSGWRLWDFIDHIPLLANDVPETTFSSSNDEIVKVVDGYLVPVSKGTAKIIATCGDFVTEMTVTVKSKAK